MDIRQAVSEAMAMLNLIEIKGEYNIAAMSRAMCLIKGIADVFDRVKDDEHNDGSDKQG